MSSYAYEKEQFGKIYSGVSRKSIMASLFKPQVMVGESWTWMVDTANPGGFTVVSGADRGTLPSLNAAIAGSAQRLTLNPSTMYLHSEIPEETIRRTSGAGADSGNSKAFANEKLRRAKQVKDSLLNLNDLAQFYGQDDVGTFNTTDSTADTATQTTVVIDAVAWIPALKSSKGHAFDFHNASTHAKVNTADIILRSTSESAKTITFTCNTTDAAALAAGATEMYLVPAGFGGKDTTVRTPGIKKFLNTTTGTLLGADFSDPNLHGTVLSAVGGPLTKDVIYSALTDVTNAQGLGSTDFVLITSTASHNDVLAAFDDEVRYVNGQGTKTQGTNKVVTAFDGHNVEHMSSSRIKRGDAFLLAKKYLQRVRSHSEECFYSYASENGGVPFDVMTDKPGIDIRAGITEAVCIGLPNACAYIPGIVPSL